MRTWSAIAVTLGVIVAGSPCCANLASAKEEPFGLTAAFEAQVWGRVSGEPGALDLDNFTRYHAKLRLVSHF
jgi:hypothetical protein